MHARAFPVDSFKMEITELVMFRLVLRDSGSEKHKCELPGKGAMLFIGQLPVHGLRVSTPLTPLFFDSQCLHVPVLPEIKGTCDLLGPLRHPMPG